MKENKGRGNQRESREFAEERREGGVVSTTGVC